MITPREIRKLEKRIRDILIDMSQTPQTEPQRFKLLLKKLTKAAEKYKAETGRDFLPNES